MKRALISSFAVYSLVFALCGSVSAASAPPTVVTGVVTSVQPTQVVLNGTVNPNGLATSFYFQYGPSSTAGFPTRTATKSAGSGSAAVPVAFTLTALAPGTSYDYRVVATNSSGTSVGATGSFNTSAAPSVTTSSASAITSSAATLNGSINPQGLATDWYFQYGLTTSYGTRTTEHAIAASPNATNVSVYVANLAPRSTYHFRLVAISKAGTTFGPDSSLTTGLAVTLNASISTVTYGQFVTLSGAVASGKPNIQVTILNQLFNQSVYSTLAAVTTGSGGAWSYTAQPSARVAYEASTSNGTSSAVTISVRPIVTLNESGGSLTTKVSADESFAGHVLQLQRLSNNTWVTWKHVRLNGRAQASFSTSLPKGRTLVRMAIGPFVPGIDQAGPGYLAGFSRSISYLNR